MELTRRIHSIPAPRAFYTGPLAPNVYLVADGGEGALIDSGFGDEGSVRARLEYLGQHPEVRLRYIILTHYHFDHASGAHQIRQATGAKVVLHPLEEGFLRDWQGEALQDVEVHLNQRSLAERMRLFRQQAAEAVPDIAVGHGDTLRVGGMALEIVHTPGHTMGSICVYVPQERALFTGDTALGLGTVVVLTPPYGDMALYLSSLERLKGYESDLMLPGHGPPVREVARKLQELIDHRQEREQQILDLLARGKRTPQEMLPALYPELDRYIVPLALRQIESHLVKLEAEGRTRRTDDGTWMLRGK